MLTEGDELKLVFPQNGATPADFAHMAFRSFRIQPLDDIHVAENTAEAVEYCLEHPQWSLSLQTHKYLRIP